MERVHPRLDRAANIRLHRVADHDHRIRLAQRPLGQPTPGAVKHVGVRLAQVVGAAPGARLEESRRGPAPGRVFSLDTGHQLSGLVANKRAPRSTHSWALASFSVVAAPSPTTT